MADWESKKAIIHKDNELLKRLKTATIENKMSACKKEAEELQPPAPI